MNTIRLIAFLLSAVALSTLAAPDAEAQQLVTADSEFWAQLYDPPHREPTEVAKGSELRKSLFDQLRPKIQQAAGGRAVLFSGSLKAWRNWAFFSGETVDPDGQPVALSELGNSDTCALWLRTVDGWRLVDYSGGHSDVFYEVWPEQYGAPRALLGFE